MTVNARSIHGLLGCHERPEDGSLPSTCGHCGDTADTLLKRRGIEMLTEHREGRGCLGLERSGQGFTEKRYELSLGLPWRGGGVGVRESESLLHPRDSSYRATASSTTPLLVGKLVTLSAGSNGDS